MPNYKSGFFDSKEGDRPYDSEDFNDLLDGILPPKGVFRTYKKNNTYNLSISGNSTASTSNDYIARMRPGKAWINNHWFINSSEHSITINKPSSMYSRIDAIYLKYDDSLNYRSIEPKVMNGTQKTDSSAITKPVVPDQNNVLILAYITFIAATSSTWNVSIENVIGTETTPYINTVFPEMEIDSEISSTSINPVQNKVIKEFIEGKIDSVTSTSSKNAVQNKAITEYVNDKTQVDTMLLPNSYKPVANKVVKENLDTKYPKTGGLMEGNINFGTGERHYGVYNADVISVRNDLSPSQAGISAGNTRIEKVANPQADTDAINKSFMMQSISDSEYTIKEISNDTSLENLDDGIYFINDGASVLLCNAFNTLYINGGFIIKNENSSSSDIKYTGIIACGCLNRTPRLSSQGKKLIDYNGFAYGYRIGTGTEKTYKFITSADLYSIENFGIIDGLDDSITGIDEDSDDKGIPTSKAVYEAIIREIDKALHPTRPETN